MLLQTSFACAVILLSVSDFTATAITDCNDGGLSPLDVKQQQCIQPNATLLNETAWLFQYPNNSFYVPMSNSHYKRSMAQVLLGCPAQDQKQLDEMNLRINIRFDPTTGTFNVTSTGYEGAFLAQNCTPTSAEQTMAICDADPAESSPQVDSDIYLTSEDRVVYQNPRLKIALIVRCVNGDLADWKVFKLSKDRIPKCIKKKILKKVKQLGLVVD